MVNFLSITDKHPGLFPNFALNKNNTVVYKKSQLDADGQGFETPLNLEGEKTYFIKIIFEISSCEFENNFSFLPKFLPLHKWANSTLLAHCHK